MCKDSRHHFKKFDDSRIFCRNCGETRRYTSPKPSQASQPSRLWSDLPPKPGIGDIFHYLERHGHEARETA